MTKRPLDPVGPEWVGTPVGETGRGSRCRGRGAWAGARLRSSSSMRARTRNGTGAVAGNGETAVAAAVPVPAAVSAQGSGPGTRSGPRAQIGGIRLGTGCWYWARVTAFGTGIYPVPNRSKTYPKPVRHARTQQPHPEKPRAENSAARRARHTDRGTRNAIHGSRDTVPATKIATATGTHHGRRMSPTSWRRAT